MAGKKKAAKVYEGGHPLAAFIMSEEDLARRRRSIGGSDANTLMSGDPRRVYDLWREKRGEGAPQGDPSINMLMGTATEALNAAWYHYKTGDIVTGVQAFESTNEHGYPAHATLDGLCKGGEAIWEAKHTGSYDFGSKAKRTIETVSALYMPQLQHNMMVTGLSRAVISVLFDNSAWASCEVEADPFYQDALRLEEEAFWAAVESGEPPGSIPVIEAAPVVSEWRDVDMTGNNEWGSAAAEYIFCKPFVKSFESAESNLKALVESDVNYAYGNGLKVKRDKRGALRVLED